VVSSVGSFGDWPHGVARLGVVLCVALGVVVALHGLSDSLHGSSFWADRHSAFDYTSRSVPREDVVGSQKVVEDARLWMPSAASYRVVAGPEVTGPMQWAAPAFLQGFLLPRRQTQSEDAPWVFCYRCDTSALGGTFEPLSDDGKGVVFGRVQP